MTTLTRHIKAWFATGPRGERVAARYLRRKGYRIVGRNVRLRAGEIDLVAQDPDRRTLVIVEVKTAALTRPNPKRAELRPEVHVGAAKKRKLASLASLLVQKHHLTDRPIRFDVVGVDLPKGSRPIVRHHIAAFESHL